MIFAFNEFLQNGETVSVVSRERFRDHDADVQYAVEVFDDYCDTLPLYHPV